MGSSLQIHNQDLDIGYSAMRWLTLHFGMVAALLCITRVITRVIALSHAVLASFAKILAVFGSYCIVVPIDFTKPLK